MFRNMNQREREWMKKLFSIDFAGRKILQKQVEKSKISLEKGYDYISLKFSIKGAPEKFPYQVRVPIEMRAFQNNSAPIQFLLHLADGMIGKLEIITADASEIHINSIALDHVEFEMNPKVQKNPVPDQ